MAVNDELINYLNRVKVRIIDEQSAAGLRLTGFSANSIQVQRSRSIKSGRFVAGAALGSTAYLVTNFKGIGVKAGVFPPFGKGSSLEKWVRQRGITTTDKDGRIQTAAQTSFLVALSIFKRGTAIRRRSRRGIDYQAILKDELPPTLDEITQDVTADIIGDFNKAILK